MNIAAIDVGSNAIRMLLASTDGSGLTPVASFREPVRLGHDVFMRGRIGEDTMSRAARAIARLAEIQKQHGVERGRAIATSAVREASNRQALVERVRRESGIELEVISGVEEGRLIYLAVKSNLDIGRSNAIIAELGGGSMELILVKEGRLEKIETYKIGAVRLLEMLTNGGRGGGVEEASFSRLVSEYIAGLRGHMQKATEGFSADRFIATGGNVEKIAALVATSPSDGKPPVVAKDDLRQLIMKLSNLSYRERIEKLGLDEDRADVILPASIVVYGVLEATGMASFVVPMVGLREGIVRELASSIEKEPARLHLHDASVYLGRRYQFDEGHALRVAQNAAFLFERLQPIHRLESRLVTILETASVLHDIGFYVNGRQHHKHSYYLIVHSNIPGLSPREKAIVANIARYHRKSPPKTAHATLATLDRSDRETVRKLAAILRIADALDRDHAGTVVPAAVQIEGSVVTLRVRVHGDLTLGQWAIGRKSGLFKDTFGYEVKAVEEA
ncbi:MAG: Ppx/GppA family phosphatase [Acidobacteria bacterium]|nr:Ppx/GppA family phosphatase [Acidobacteriota bacterium]